MHVVAGHMNPGQLRAFPSVNLMLGIHECLGIGDTVLRVF